MAAKDDVSNLVDSDADVIKVSPTTCKDECCAQWSVKLSQGQRKRERKWHKERMKRLQATDCPDSGAPSVTEGVATVRTSDAVKGSCQKLNLLLTHTPGSVEALTGTEWEEIDIGVDSGASETVINESMIANCPLLEGDHKRKGVQYEIATGQLIPNLGEKRFIGVSENLVERGITAQVADVSTPLLSVRKMLKSGHRVIFDSEGSYIEDKATGEFMSLRDDGNMFMLKLWCRRGEGF